MEIKEALEVVEQEEYIDLEGAIAPAEIIAAGIQGCIKNWNMTETKAEA